MVVGAHVCARLLHLGRIVTPWGLEPALLPPSSSFLPSINQSTKILKDQSATREHKRSHIPASPHGQQYFLLIPIHVQVSTVPYSLLYSI